MKTTVIFHNADFDGLFCYQIAKKFLPPDTEFIGWDFKDAPLPLPDPDTQLYILDLPVDRPFGLEFGKHPTIEPIAVALPLTKIVWIDHHKSSIESHPTLIPGYRIDGVAACRLCYQWLEHLEHLKRSGYHNPNFEMSQTDLPKKDDFFNRKVEEPLAVRLAGEYDIWDKRDPNAEIFQFGLRSVELRDFEWTSMLSMDKPSIEDVERMVDIGMKDVMYPDGTVTPPIVGTLLQNGKILQAYQQRNDAGTMGRSFLVLFEGLRFLALNTARCNSLTFAAKDVPETGHDALMGFYFDGEKWNVSLYHAKHNMGIDLSEIAKRFGGGGHRGACGMRVAQLPFVSDLNQIECRAWLDGIRITSENIGDIRRRCMMPFDSAWNSFVRDETAARENK